MYEVEVKVSADHEAVHERIEALDVTFQGTIRQEDTYYDAPHRDFAATDEALRVRRESPVETAGEPETAGGGGTGGTDGTDRTDGSDGSGETGDSDERSGTEPEGEGSDAARAVLTYKGPLVDDESKTRREIETGMKSAEAIEGVLSALGFAPAATVSKTRSVYSAADGEWTLVRDSVEGLGEFVEVELESREEDVEAARKRVRDVLRALDLDPDEGIRTSYLEMLFD
jgi:adenylate cyclase class 2